jgi:response regulator RpfG family c-di-GMP phosphodiesterase
MVDAAVSGALDASLSTYDVDRLDSAAHALQTALISIRIGAQLGLDRATLAELGAAALLHDTGKRAVAEGLPVRVEDRDSAMETRARTHVLEGVRQIAGGNALHEGSLLAMRVALEHHAYGPAAYPALPEQHRRSPLSEIVAIADAFLCLRFSRGAGNVPRTPSEALAAVLGPLAGAFDPALRAALVRAVGLHPPGQIVELDDGSLAIVLATPPTTPERPQVEWLTGPNREALPETEARPAGPLPEDRRVARALPRTEWPFAETFAA